MGSARAWVIWGTGVAAYAVAVLQRSSFGVAGIAAAGHFGTTGGIVSTFVVLQLLVYTLMQIPAGLMLDRFGTRIMVCTGAAAMACGQALLASADTLALGIVARVLVGAGDACTFGAVVRLVPAWFPPRQAPMLIQLTGLLGQAGQIASAVPLARILEDHGWRPAFLAAAACSLVMLVVSGLVLRDSPSAIRATGRAGSTTASPPAGAGPAGPACQSGDGPFSATPGDTASADTTQDPHAGTGPPAAARRADTRAQPPLGEQVSLAWAHPATRLAMWTHFATVFSPNVFAMMWGYPYLRQGEGLPGPVASALISLFVIASVVIGPLVAMLTARYPQRRYHLAMSIVALIAASWAAVLAWPGPAPMWLLIVLATALAAGGPGSGVGIDLARSYTPPGRLGTATGITIMGGFAGGLAAILVIGLALDHIAAGGAYQLGHFRLALAVQFVLFIAGMTGMRATWRQLARHQAAGGTPVRPLRTALADRWRRFCAARAGRR